MIKRYFKKLHKLMKSGRINKVVKQLYPEEMEEAKTTEG